MKSAHAAAIAFLFLATPAIAQDWAMRAGDEPIRQYELAAFLAAAAVRFYDGGRSEYGPGAAYAYVYANENRAEGRYRVESDGAVCVDFANGLSRCDVYVRNNGRVLLIDQKGKRFPVVP